MESLALVGWLSNRSEVKEGDQIGEVEPLVAEHKSKVKEAVLADEAESLVSPHSSELEEADLADKAKSLVALVVVPGALEEHGTVLVAAIPLVVVGLSAVPVDVVRLAPCGHLKL